jgi:predicted nucleic acid-binding protein
VNLVDSSAWLSYFADDELSAVFADPIEKTEELIVPTVCLYEVFKRVLQQRGEDAALQAAALMQQGTVVELSGQIALTAAQLGIAHKLAMADSLILATAKYFNAVLWTQDSDFQGLENVHYFPKKKS